MFELLFTPKFNIKMQRNIMETNYEPENKRALDLLPINIWFLIFEYLPMFELTDTRKISKSFIQRNDLLFPLLKKYDYIFILKMAVYFLTQQTECHKKGELCHKPTWQDIFDNLEYLKKPAFMDVIFEGLKPNKNFRWTGKCIINRITLSGMIVSLNDVNYCADSIPIFEETTKEKVITIIVFGIFEREKGKKDLRLYHTLL